MSLVDITPLPDQDENMDPTNKQYVDSSIAISAALSDTKLAEFRATLEAYTARADEREAAAREREAAAREREAAARELERIRHKDFEARIDAFAARADEREAAAKERELMAKEREANARAHELERAQQVERRMAQFEKTVAGVKRAVITTGIAATLSTVLGVAAFNAALIQNMQAAFEAGRQASPAQVKMQSDIDDIKRQLAEMRAAGNR